MTQIVNTTTSGNSFPVAVNCDNTLNGALTLGSSGGVATDGSGHLRWGASVDGTIYKNHTFSKPGLEEKIKEFQAGKYTRKYIETYLDFMVMNAMLDNLEYLEYKANLDGGSQK